MMRGRFEIDEDGVSVVIGTILMVLLTIILVSFLLYYAMTFIDDLPDDPLEGEDEDNGMIDPDLSAEPPEPLLEATGLPCHAVIPGHVLH